MLRALLLALLVLAPHPARADAPWDRFDSDLAAMRALEPHPEGSESSRKLLELLRERLSDMAVPYRTMDFEDSEEMHSFAGSVIATIAGDRPDTVLLCVPLDSPPPERTVRGESIGPALALEMARQMAASRPPLTVQILFLGAEQGQGEAYPMSSRLFLQGYYPESPVLALYLRLGELESGPQRILIRAGSEGIVAPRWLLQRSLAAFESAGLEARADGTEIQLARAGLVKVHTPIGPFLRAGYPAVAIEGDVAPAGGEHAFAVAFGGFWHDFLDSNRQGIPKTWERHYLLFRVGRHHIFASEHDYLILLLGIFAASVGYIQLARKRLSQDFAVTRERIWLLPILFAATLVFLLASTTLLYVVQAVRGVEDLWVASPALFVALKVSATAFLLLVADRLLSRFAGQWFARIPARFFPASALLVLVCGLMIVGAADVSLAVVFFWPLFFVFLYEASRWVWLRFAAFLLAPASIATIGHALVVREGSDAGRILLLAPLGGNIVMAVLLLPYVLLLLDLTVTASIPRPTAQLVRRVAPAVAGILSAGLLAAAFVFPPFGSSRPQVLDVTRYVDLTAGSSRIEVTSSAPLGTIRYAEAGNVKTISTRARTRLLPSETPGNMLSVRSSSVPVLDRENVTLWLEPEGSPENVEVAIVSPDKFLLFDSSFPGTRDESGRVYTLHIGRYPPQPLAIELTLPRGGRFSVAIRLTYENAPTSVELPGRNRIVRSRMVVDDGFDLRT